MINGWINGIDLGFLSIEVTTKEISKNFTNWKVGKYRDSQGKLHEKDESFPIELEYILPEGEGVRYFKNIYASEHELLHSIYMENIKVLKNPLYRLDLFEISEQVRVLESLGISEEVTVK